MTIRRNHTTLLVPKQDNWRWVMRDLTAGLDGVEYWLVRRQQSGSWLVGVSSDHQKSLMEVLDRAVEKLS